MKRIYIDKRIIDVAEEYAKKLFSKKRSDFKKPLEELDILEKHLRTNYSSNQQHANYIKAIIDNYSELKKIQPQDFDNYQEKFFNNLTENDLKIKFSIPSDQTKQKQFYELIVDAMRYDAARIEFYKYVRDKLGIKACVYCNAQLAATVVEDNGTFNGMYELDHFYPKSKYPYLCTSFFNLQPCCANCNKSKSHNEAKFCLYTNDYSKIYPFEFLLDKKSLVKYMLNQNCEELKINFASSEVGLKDDQEKHFHISKLYETQTDLAEEIIWRSKIYSESYQETLKKSFAKLSLKQSDFKRFIIGNYYKQEDIHKRPMSKLVQDIARQLKLIEN
jgi:hypothetical protein